MECSYYSILQVATDLYDGACVASQQTQSICITFVQCWSNVEDVGATLYTYNENVCSNKDSHHSSIFICITYI